MKPPLQVLDRRFRIGVRGEEGVKGAVLLDELQHHVGVLDGRLDLASVADHGRVLHDRFDLLRTQVRDVPRVEAVKRLQEPGPLVLDDLPVQPGGENRLGQLLEIGARVARVRLSDLTAMRLGPGGIGGHTVPPFTSRFLPTTLPLSSPPMASTTAAVLHPTTPGSSRGSNSLRSRRRILRSVSGPTDRPEAAASPSSSRATANAGGTRHPPRRSPRPPR